MTAAGDAERLVDRDGDRLPATVTPTCLTLSSATWIRLLSVQLSLAGVDEANEVARSTIAAICREVGWRPPEELGYRRRGGGG